jgi:hypothetical protein
MTWIAAHIKNLTSVVHPITESLYWLSYSRSFPLLFLVHIFAFLLIAFAFHCQHTLVRQGALGRCVSYLRNGNSNRKQILALCTLEACFICVAALVGKFDTKTGCWDFWRAGLMDWLAAWPSGRWTDWLTDCLDWLDEWLTNQFIDWLIAWIDWTSDELTDWQAAWIYRLAYWLNNWLPGWLAGWLTDLLTG